MFLNKNNLKVSQFASPSKIKPELASVLIDNEKTVATDAFRLVEVSIPKTRYADEDYPATQGMVKKLEKAILLPAKAMGNFKQVKAHKNLEVLNFIVLMKSGEKEYALKSTNLEDTLVAPMEASDADNFPKYETLFPKNSLRKYTLNGRFLGEVLLALAEIGANEHVELHVPDEITKPIMVTAEGNGQTARALVMMVRT